MARIAAPSHAGKSLPQDFLSLTQFKRSPALPGWVRPRTLLCQGGESPPGVKSCHIVTRRQLHRREAAWGAVGGERTACRMTNPFRRHGAASLPTHGEARVARRLLAESCGQGARFGYPQVRSRVGLRYRKGMRDTDLFQLALGLTSPWKVMRAEFSVEEGRLDLHVDFPAGSRFVVRRMRRRGLRGPRHENRDVAASGFLSASRILARAHAAGDLPDMWSSQGRGSLGSRGIGFHASV